MIRSTIRFQSVRPQRREDEVLWRVWSPKARQVELVLENSSGEIRAQMESSEEGLFVLSLPNIQIGQRYGYSLDGGPTRPDPATVSQPDGVHQPSAIYFPNEYEWLYPGPSLKRHELVLYEMHIGTFTKAGTFDAAQDKLADLVDLGINALEILPVAQFPGERNWGYDGVHPMATQNCYGGPKAFQQFIDEAHRVGLAVILDVVFNHLGPEGNYLHEFAPYFTERHPTPWGPGFDFDGKDARPVRDWFLECTWQWIHDFRLDGLRLDAVHAMVDDSGKHILTEIKETADKAAHERGGEAIVIAESLLNDPKIITPANEGGLGLDLEWNEDFHHAVSGLMTGEVHGKYIDYRGIETILRVMQENQHLSGQDSIYYGKSWGKPAGNIAADRFVISLQNHDHIGNRAQGERLASLVNYQKLRLGACLTILGPFVPMLFMGEEYGETNPFLFFCSFNDTEVIRGVRSGRKRDYGLQGTVPDPQMVNSFNSSVLSWDWSRPERSELRKLYQTLIALRKSTPALSDGTNRGDTALVGAPGEERLRVDRGDLTCWFNLSAQAHPDPGGKVLWRSEPESGFLAPYETILVFR